MTIHGLVHDWLEAKGLDFRPGANWVRRLLRGMRLSSPLPNPAGASDRVVPPRCQASSAGQHRGGHDIHGRLQHRPWPAGHAGADRASGQDSRRLAGATLAGAHSPRQRMVGPPQRRSCSSQPHWTTC